MGLESSGEMRIQSAFSDVSFESGGECYFSLSSADEIIDMCSDEELAIIGIEVFAKSNGNLRPELELIADFSSTINHSFSWDEVVTQTTASARIFVRRIVTSPKRWLNLTLMSEGEFRRLQP